MSIVNTRFLIIYLKVSLSLSNLCAAPFSLLRNLYIFYIFYNTISLFKPEDFLNYTMKNIKKLFLGSLRSINVVSIIL